MAGTFEIDDCLYHGTLVDDLFPCIFCVSIEWMERVKMFSIHFFTRQIEEEENQSFDLKTNFFLSRNRDNLKQSKKLVDDHTNQ